MSTKVSVIGASGYVGGELLRLLSRHPGVEIVAAHSRVHAGEYVHRVHPNLRGVLSLQFTGEDPVSIASKSDLVFLSVPHGASVKLTPKLVDMGVRIIDMSADFRLKDPSAYKLWYHYEHPYPDLLGRFVYGLPELHREELRGARYASAPGCNAAAAILALAPLARSGMIRGTIVVDVKVGSSGAGGKPSLATHFSERFGVVRPYAPAGHRHVAEIEQELRVVSGREHAVAMSAHSVNMVRGILSTSHVFVDSGDMDPAKVWRAYREMYRDEPFIRFVRDKKGIFRYPDPKIVVGSNFADIGFELDPHTSRIVALSAIDNLMKGAAGSALQAMNLMLGFDERTALDAAPLHPI
jgi:N-acetyl-gamma-glutamyl-phosphate/LysW-gamma-L-alpha-aminoadipyl-6-phosphate reductase